MKHGAERARPPIMERRVRFRGSLSPRYSVDMVDSSGFFFQRMMSRIVLTKHLLSRDKRKFVMRKNEFMRKSEFMRSIGTLSDAFFNLHACAPYMHV